MPSPHDFLEHARWLHVAASACGAEVIIAGGHLHALLRRGTDHRLLLPRFLTATAAGTVLTPTLFVQSRGFGGWLAYPGKRWPIGADKLQFKEFARAAGLPVLEAFTDPASAPEGVVAKRAAPGSTPPARGPFRSASEQPLAPGQGAYYERHVEGDRLRIWFWNEAPICAQLDRPPAVIGDGRSPLRDLILHRASYTGPRTEAEGLALLAEATLYLRFHGRTLETVLAPGERQGVALRHGSPLRHPSDRHTIDLRAAAELPWAPLAREAGAKLFAAIPDPIRQDTLYAMDGILDAKDQLWLLDLDCNPTVHPFAYPAILQSLFEATSEAPAAAPGDSPPSASRSLS